MKNIFGRKSIEDKLVKIDAELKALRDATPFTHQTEQKIIELDAQRTALLQELQQSAPRPNAKNTMSPTGGTQTLEKERNKKLLIHGIIALAIVSIIFWVISLFVLNVFPLVYVYSLPIIGPGLEQLSPTIHDLISQVSVAWCGLSLRFERLDLATSPNAFDAVYREKCLNQINVIGGTETYKKILTVSYSLEPSTTPGTNFVGEINYEPASLKGKVTFKLDGLKMGVAFIGKSGYSLPRIYGEGSSEYKKLFKSCDPVCDLKDFSSSCIETPCVFTEDQKDDSRKTSLNFVWDNPDWVKGQCNNLDLSSIIATATISYQYSTPSKLSKIIISDKKVPEQEIKSDIYGPVSAEAKILNGNVVVIPKQSTTEQQFRLNIIVKNNGEGDDSGTAQLNKVYLEIRHAAQVPPLQFSECNIEPVSYNTFVDYTTDKISFENLKLVLDEGAISPGLIACTVKLKYPYVTGEYEYTLSPAIGYSYNLTMSKVTSVTYSGCTSS